MPISIADNFQYKGTKPLDKRIQYATVSDMVDTPLADLYDGCLAYVTATKKNYQYDSNNTVDQTLGKWREFSSGGGGSTYTAGDGIDITNDVISTVKSQASDMDEIVSDLPTGGTITVTGFTPIGTIISVFSETAPRNFLICDGSVYNKADYPELAYHLLHLTTHSQYEVDGDDTKFKVPDLRGEFLRGTGTNSHTHQGSGANVGVHQDGTEHANLAIDYQRPGQVALYSSSRNNNSNVPSSVNSDSSITSTDKNGWTGSYFNAETWTSNGHKSYTSRPTNTSVLYCIAVRDIYTNPMNDYSTSEKVVGSWIDGKPIYQKTIDCGTLPNDGVKDVDTGITNIGVLISIEAVANDTSNYGYLKPLPFVYVGSDGNETAKWSEQILVTAPSNQSAMISFRTRADRTSEHAYVTIKYTKTTD